MAMNFVKKLPIPAEVKKMYPLSDRVVEIKKKRDAEIRDVFTGASDKFILIIGPLLGRQCRLGTRLHPPPCEDTGQDRRPDPSDPAYLYKQAAHNRRGLQGSRPSAGSGKEAGCIRRHRRDAKAPCRRHRADRPDLRR